MASLEIGIQVDGEKGIANFGLEELNRRIANGARVVEVKPGGALMKKTGSADGKTTLILSGCKFEVVLTDS